MTPGFKPFTRKVLLDNLQWMRAMKKDPTFKKVIETQKELKDTDGFDGLPLPNHMYFETDFKVFKMYLNTIFLYLNPI